MKPLPTEPFVYAEWSSATVGLDYHVEVAKHYYSVPHALLREELWARITATTVELFHRGNRVAVHVRSSSGEVRARVARPCASTCRRATDAMPTGRRQASSGEGERDRTETSALIEIILREKTHPEQGFRATIGILGHANSFGPERLEAACVARIRRSARAPTRP